MLLTTIAGALAAAGIVGGTILKLGAARRPRPARLRARRGPIWEPTDDDRIVLSARPGADPLRRRERLWPHRQTKLERRRQGCGIFLATVAANPA